MFLDALLDAVLDSLKLLPFLFLTYLLMEYIENRTTDYTKQALRRSGKFGPVLGGLLGVVPQCGFSAAASNLYAGRVITMGTLIAVYLSTSDEMLPVMLSEQVPISFVLKILALKAGIGLVVGILVDFTINKRAFWLEMKRKGDLRKNNPFHIQEMCEQEHCQCSEGIWKSAIQHTLQVFVFLFVISLLLNLGIEAVGEEGLKHFVMNIPVLGVILAAIIGLIPNCAASVVLTELYLEGATTFGALMSGLLVGAGIGLLVLVRVNHDIRDNAKVIGTLWVSGVLAGIIIDLIIKL